MTRSRTVLLAAVFLAGFGLWTAAANSQPQPKNKVSDFMALKLEHTQGVLDGLVREDFAKVDTHAQRISLLTHDEAWQVIQTPEYRRRSDEFRRAADNIAKAAQKKNIDGATLAYVEMTLQCVSCHRAIRDAK